MVLDHSAPRPSPLLRPNRSGQPKSPTATDERRWTIASAMGYRRFAKQVHLGRYAEDHLLRKRALCEGVARWLDSVSVHLEEAVWFFGSETPLESIHVLHVEAYLAHLLARSNRRGGTLSPSTVNKYLNSLSNLFRRAIADGCISANPVQQLFRRPSPGRSPTLWLEVPEIAAVLRAARAAPKRADLGFPFLYELVATYAYTGVREGEAYRLRCNDVNLERRVLHVRGMEAGAGKTAHAERTITLASEFCDILAPFLATRALSSGDLVFPSPRGCDVPLRNMRRAFDRLPMPERLRAADGAIPPLRTRVLRHSYCAARLQTTVQGLPISPYTVARELGHQGLRMVLTVYAHLGQHIYRAPEIRYLT